MKMLRSVPAQSRDDERHEATSYQATRLGGGTGGAGALVSTGRFMPGNITSGAFVNRNGASTSGEDGSISLSSFTEGETGNSFDLPSDFLAAAILQHSAHGFSPLKVSLAASSRPSSFE